MSGMVREYVYISDAKVLQLVKDLPGGFGRTRSIEGEIKTPVVGFKFGKGVDQAKSDLAAAFRALDASDRNIAWFAEDRVRAGRWIEFEAPLSHRIVGHAVVFLDSGESTDDYPTGGRLRLLLHGSRRHLVGEPPTDLDDNIPNLLPSSSWVTFCEYLLDTIVIRKGRPRKASDIGWRPYGSDDVKNGIEILTDVMQTRYTAEWMAGRARVTAKIPTDDGVILAASPLYVERVDPPNGITGS